MADLATPSAAAMSTIDAGAEHPEKDQKQTGRPTKPDEDAYKKNLQRAEKEHAAAQEKIVCGHLLGCLAPSPLPLNPMAQLLRSDRAIPQP